MRYYDILCGLAMRRHWYGFMHTGHNLCTLLSCCIVDTSVYITCMLFLYKCQSGSPLVLPASLGEISSCNYKL